MTQYDNEVLYSAMMSLDWSHVEKGKFLLSFFATFI